MWKYLKQVLISLDQLINAVFGGWADETMSAHAFRLERDGKPFGFLRKIYDAILFFDPRHCAVSYESEKLRLQSPPELR